MEKKRKLKSCKGTGDAKGHGCGELKEIYRYGLCGKCYPNWLYNTPAGKKKVNRVIPIAKKKVEKENKPKQSRVKWEDKEFSDMVKYVQEQICNPYIRARDNYNYGKCISSNCSITDAGHRFPVSTHPQLRFIISNIHGQNIGDNRFNPDHTAKYDQGLIERHGQKYLNDLEALKKQSYSWRKLTKWDVLRIGKTYKYLHKNKIWCFCPKEFKNYIEIVCK
jgi:hypothetical protein